MEYKFTKHPSSDLIEKWNLFVAGQMTGSLFQMTTWKDLFDPKTHRWIFFWGEEENQIRFVALIKERVIPFLGRDCFIERGPVCDNSTYLKDGLRELLSLLKNENAIRLRLNPYWEFPAGKTVESNLQEIGFDLYQRTQDSHFETLTIDLRKEADEIFKHFRRDTRWRIKNSKKIGITVRPAKNEEDLKAFYELFAKMSQRKRMRISTYTFFLRLWKKVLKDQSFGILMLSIYQDHLLSGIILTVHGPRAVYSWGASDVEFREKISKNHLALWEGILWAKEKGCQIFDMGGYTGSKGGDPVMENIDSFKTGFGGEYRQLIKVHRYVFQRRKESWLRLLFPEK